uniref:Uncharacterized protein n=1 Tax=Panagrolaimus superbus TaxID=310955 RepID=A0A914Y1G8_9BILA
MIKDESEQHDGNEVDNQSNILLMFIERILCDEYPLHLKQYVTVGENPTFGCYQRLQNVNKNLHMYDTLNLSNPNAQLHSMKKLIDRYTASVATTQPKHGKTGTVCKINVMETLYIQFMLYSDAPGDARAFLHLLPKLISFNARLFDVLNSKTFALNTKSEMRNIKCSINAFATFELQRMKKNISLHHETSLQATWQEIRDHSIVLDTKNLMKYKSAVT